MRSLLKFLLFNWVLFPLLSCSKDDELPSVSIIKPVFRDSFVSGDTIQVDADIRSVDLRFIETPVR